MFIAAEKTSTIREILTWAEGYLARYEVPDSSAEAEYLLAHVLGCRRVELHLNHSETLAINKMQVYRDCIERRIKREPSQYITGEQEFWGLSFKVTRNVLIPRPETELLVEEAVNTVASGQWSAVSKDKINSALTTDHSPRILDLCTGSGCIAISIAKEIPDCMVYATDISEIALSIAKENAERHGVADRINFLQGDLFEPLKGIKADIVVSNPPYISKKTLKELQPEVRDFEPRTALYGGNDGLDFYRRIISESHAYLNTEGCLMLEIGYGQAEEIRGFFENRMFQDIEIKKDLAGIDRVVKARFFTNRNL